jgi:hypothetical protein
METSVQAGGLNADASTATNKARGARIFISYKRNSRPDEEVARRVYEALRAQHEVFIDQLMPVGTVWAKRIEEEIRRSDFFIALLSSQSIHSEMVKGEIEKAHEVAKEQQGRPVLLPVRLAYNEPLPYSLGPYLNHINWAFWNGEADTPSLIQNILQAISSGELIETAPFQQDAPQQADGATAELIQPLPAAQPVLLELPEGTMDTESHFYVERSFDIAALQTIKRSGVTITIKGPRQMGKSSLLIRTIHAAMGVGKRIAFLDFQLFDKAALTDADLFFRQFCSWLTDSLEMTDRVEEHWVEGLGNSQRTARYLSRYILKELGSPLVLAMDEVDRLFEADFRSDFFGMLRNWHNSRAFTPLWKRLDLAIVTSTEPYQLIENLNQSPFNVGEIIDLTDFTDAQVSDLNGRHGSPLSPADEQQLMALLNGHPYLVRRALYLIASQRLTLQELLDHATDDRGPFGDHLRYHLFRLHNKSELVEGLRNVIRNQRCQDDLTFFRLRGAGLVRREGKKELMRCALYEDYFREHLHV